MRVDGFQDDMKPYYGLLRIRRTISLILIKFGLIQNILESDTTKALTRVSYREIQTEKTPQIFGRLFYRIGKKNLGYTECKSESSRKN